jgi:tetratricopeptide (TPR) repeat protein
MGKLNVERLAHYYDNALKYESAVKDYEKALPGLIVEFNEAPQHDKPEVSDRLVEALIRIGDLESGLNSADPGKQALSAGAYELAKQITSKDPRVEARIGYHYLLMSELDRIKANTEILKCPEKSGSGSSGNQEATSSTEDPHCKTERQLDSKAHAEFETAQTQLNSSIYDQYGVYHWRDTFVWMYANYGYLLARSGDTKHAEKMLWCALFYGNPSSRDDNCPPENEHFFQDNEELRAAAASAYAWSRNGLSGPLAKAKWCDPNATAADKTDNPTCTIGSLLNKATEPITAHNYVLVESQLQNFYEALEKIEKKDSAEGGPPTNRELHRTGMYLLVALMEYRAGNHKEALARIDSARIECKNDGITRLLELAEAFIVSTWEVHSPMQDRKSEPMHKKLQAAESDLERLLAGPKDELYTRALSLNAVRKAMELDDNTAVALPFGGAASARLVANAVEASDAMPENAYLHANVGIVKLRANPGDLPRVPPASLKEFTEAVRINPGDPWLRCLLAHAREANGEIEEAQTQAQFGRLLDPSRWNDYDKAVHGVWLKLAPGKDEKEAHEKVNSAAKN